MGVDSLFFSPASSRSSFRLSSFDRSHLPHHWQVRTKDRRLSNSDNDMSALRVQVGKLSDKLVRVIAERDEALRMAAENEENEIDADEDLYLGALGGMISPSGLQGVRHHRGRRRSLSHIGGTGQGVQQHLLHGSSTVKALRKELGETQIHCDTLQAKLTELKRKHG